MTSPITFTVHGTPAPQGSKSAFVNRHTGRATLVESSKAVKPWRAAVVTEAQRHAGQLNPDEIWRCSILFAFPRPKTHYRSGRFSDELKPGAPIRHTQKPDLDKLTRSTWDALTTAGIIRDDAQIPDAHIRKIWIDKDEPAHATITLWA